MVRTEPRQRLGSVTMVTFGLYPQRGQGSLLEMAQKPGSQLAEVTQQISVWMHVSLIQGGRNYQR